MAENIKNNTQENIEATREVASAVQNSTVQIIRSLSEIQKGFTEISKSGGVIANPTGPEQFYHNARIQEQSGDYLNARKSYNRFFSFKLNFIDPHLRYQTFLKIQEGRAGAREIYHSMYEIDTSPVVEFARILLFDSPKRTEMLRKFIEDNPDFTPAYYELSREFSEARKGIQTLKDKRSELAALQKFSRNSDQGKFVKYFIDKEIAARWINNTERRLLQLNKNKKLTMPVSSKVQPYTKNVTEKLCCDGNYCRPYNNLFCTDELKDRTISSEYIEIFIQISEEAIEPILSDEGGTYKPDVEKLKISNNTTEFYSYVPEQRFVGNKDFFINYFDMNGEIQGPYKISIDREKIVLNFIDKLVEKNIDINLPINDNKIKKVSGFPYNELLNKLNTFELSRVNLLASAAALNQITVVERLLSLGVLVDGYFVDDGSQSKAVELFLEEYGAYSKKDVHENDNDMSYKYCNLTPLIIAVDNGNNQIAKMFINNGANLDLSSRIGDVNDVAECKKNEEILSLIKAKKTNKAHPCRCGNENSVECRGGVESVLFPKCPQRTAISSR